MAWTSRRKEKSRGERAIRFIRSQYDFIGGTTMPVTVKNISLWRKEVENEVGMLAHALEPVTKAGANLRVLMGYRYPGDSTKAAIELYPLAGKKVAAAAAGVGLV